MKALFRGLGVWGVVGAIVNAAAAAVLAAPMVLVDETTPPCPVVVAPKTAGHERQAALLLTNYLWRITGRPFALLETATAPTGRVILVGAAAGAAPVALPGDSFVIRADDTALRFSGATPMATAFAVTAFLEEHLGCRFWSWNEEDIPLQPAIRVAAFERVQRALFVQGEVWNQEAQTRENGFVYKARGKSTEQMTGNHTLYRLLTPYGQQHPEIYPYSEKTGTRAPNDLHFCYLAPGIAEALAEALAKVVDTKQGNVRDFVYFAGMGDWYGGFCQCEVCKKVYEEEAWTRSDGKRITPQSATLTRMINRTAELLEKRYPGIRVGTMAYMTLEAPPGLTRPRANVIIQIPHLRHCLAHAVDRCDANHKYRENLERWCQIAPGRVYIWDYNVNFGGNFMYPFPTLTAMADNLRYYAKLGCAGVAIQGNYVSLGSDLVVAKNYVLRKVMWNPALKTEDLLVEFCKGYYGPVADDMLAYIRLQEGLAGASDAAHFMEFIDLPDVALNPKRAPAWLGAERIADYRNRLAVMLAKCAGQEPWTRRVREAGASVEAVESWGKPVPLLERGDRLVRSDRGDTYEGFKEFLKYTRDCSPGEFGMARAYQLMGLGQQGGPLCVLTNGDVVVKLAPAIGARVYQMLYRGKPLLWVPQRAIRGYPYVGGSFSRVFSGATSGGVRTAQLVGQPTATHATMEGEAGIELWSTLTRQIHARTVELMSGGTVRITGTARYVMKVHTNAVCSEVTQYQGAPGRADPVVEAQRADGRWEALVFRAVQETASSSSNTAGPGLLQGMADKAAEQSGVVAAPATVKAGPGAWRPVRVAREVIWEVELPKDALVFRIHLSTAGCVVEDRYVAPEGTGGTAFYNETTGVISLRVDLTPVPVLPTADGTWMVRELRFAPLTAVPDGGESR